MESSRKRGTCFLPSQYLTQTSRKKIFHRKVAKTAEKNIKNMRIYARKTSISDNRYFSILFKYLLCVLCVFAVNRYELLRVRDSGLVKLSDADVVINLSHQKLVVQIICNYILKQIYNRYPETTVKIKEYLISNVFYNEDLYNELIGRLPAPSRSESFGAKFPDIANEWDITANKPLDPYMFLAGSNHRAWWVCKQNTDHKWQTAINNRTSIGKTGCPYCAFTLRGKKRKTASINKHGTISKKRPDLIAEWDWVGNTLITPDTVSIKSNEYTWWVCTCGHKWKQQIIKRCDKNYSCPKCAKKKRALSRMAVYAETQFIIHMLILKIIMVFVITHVTYR